MGHVHEHLKSIGLVLAFAVLSVFNSPVQALAERDHMVKHGFLLLGTSEVFATHIVARPPHNWQVNLQLTLDTDTLGRYLSVKQSFKDGNMILVLDPVDIGQLDQASRLTGIIIFKHSDGTSVPVADHVVFKSGEFKVLYSKELPEPGKSNPIGGWPCYPPLPGSP